METEGVGTGRRLTLVDLAPPAPMLAERCSGFLSFEMKLLVLAGDVGVPAVLAGNFEGSRERAGEAGDEVTTGTPSGMVGSSLTKVPWRSGIAGDAVGGTASLVAVFGIVKRLS